MHIRAALIRETRVNAHLSLKNGSEISFELPFVSRRKRRRGEGREIEKGGKSDGNTRGHVVFIARTSKDSSKRMEMCDGKWETNCSNSILNLGHVSILDTLSEESLPRMRSDVHVSLYTPEEGCWLLPTLSSFLSLPFFSPLPFFVLSDFRETMSFVDIVATTNWTENEIMNEIRRLRDF